MIKINTTDNLRAPIQRAALIIAAVMILAITPSIYGEEMAELPTVPEGFEEATFGAGCFWGVEKRFQRLPGVSEAVSGFAGGDVKDPTYRQVCSGTTGHAEVVRVIYDPERITYQELLETYWRLGVPQGRFTNKGNKTSQYRHIILYHNQKQKRLAEASIKELSDKLSETISVYVEPLEDFYPAERYHQDYLLGK